MDDVTTFSANRDTMLDANGENWNEECGQANLVYSSLPNWMSVDSDFVLTVAPVLVSSVGDHVITLTKQDPNGLIPNLV